MGVRSLPSTGMEQSNGPVWTAAVVLTVDISTLTFLGRTSESDWASVVSVDCSNRYWWTGVLARVRYRVCCRW